MASRSGPVLEHQDRNRKSASVVQFDFRIYAGLPSQNFEFAASSEFFFSPVWAYPLQRSSLARAVGDGRRVDARMTMHGMTVDAMSWSADRQCGIPGTFTGFYFKI